MDKKFKDVDAPLVKLPLFCRKGFNLPYQATELTRIDQMRKQPIKIIAVLDKNCRSQGKIFIDDGINANPSSSSY